MRLAAFTGHWQVERRIDDRLAGRTGRFTGTARFTPVADGLAYREKGHLEMDGAPPMTASRADLWREDFPGTISVCFEDGRPFHRIVTGETIATDVHDCPPDLYRVRYDFAAWPDWSTEWQVRGPRKDYTMTTTYRRAGQGGGIGA